MANVPKPILSNDKQGKDIASKVKSILLRPALTSQFEVYVNPPSGSKEFFSANLVLPPDDGFRLMCSDATLPGSSLATHESNNDFHGTTERFAYRRIYDDRIDLTYYVDSEDYYSIRFFETWIKYIANESIKPDGGKPSSEAHEYFYRFRYPDGDEGYRTGSALYVTKFERDYGLPGKRRGLVYQFINPYPISIQSMPVSYDSSNLLKCTVSMTYIRYIVNPNVGGVDNSQDESEPGQSTANGVERSPFDLTPQRQAEINAVFTQNFNFGNLSAGTLTNTNFNP